MVVPPYLLKVTLKRDLVTNKTAVQRAEPKFSTREFEVADLITTPCRRVKIVWSPWNHWLDVIALETALMFVQRRLRCLSDERD